jgi:hypothetical protein
MELLRRAWHLESDFVVGAVPGYKVGVLWETDLQAAVCSCAYSLGAQFDFRGKGTIVNAITMEKYIDRHSST